MDCHFPFIQDSIHKKYYQISQVLKCFWNYGMHAFNILDKSEKGWVKENATNIGKNFWR